METVTLKMDKKHIALLKQEAKALGRSQAAIVRDLIDEHLAQKRRPSLYEQAKDKNPKIRRVKIANATLWPYADIVKFVNEIANPANPTTTA